MLLLAFPRSLSSACRSNARCTADNAAHDLLAVLGVGNCRSNAVCLKGAGGRQGGGGWKKRMMPSVGTAVISEAWGDQCHAMDNAERLTDHAHNHHAPTGITLSTSLSSSSPLSRALSSQRMPCCPVSSRSCPSIPIRPPPTRTLHRTCPRSSGANPVQASAAAGLRAPLIV